MLVSNTEYVRRQAYSPRNNNFYQLLDVFSAFNQQAKHMLKNPIIAETEPAVKYTRALVRRRGDNLFKKHIGYRLFQSFIDTYCLLKNPRFATQARSDMQSGGTCERNPTALYEIGSFPGEDGELDLYASLCNLLPHI